MRFFALLFVLGLVTVQVSGQGFRRPPMQFPADVTRAAVLGDVDGDGDPDAITRAGVVHLNDGTGRFAPHPVPSPLLIPLEDRQSTHLADLDGDGDLDLVRTYPIVGGWLNDGAGVFSASALPLPPGPPMRAAVFEDLDGDGDVDMFGVVSAPPCIGTGWAPCATTAAIWLNDGAGGLFDSSALLPAGLMVTSRFPAVLDLDGDGFMEIFIPQAIVPGTTPAPLMSRMLLVRPAPGNAYAPVSIPGPQSHILDLVTGDFDGDGLTDVFVAGGGIANPLQEEVYLNLGNGTLAPPAIFPRDNFSAKFSRIDLDGDGTDELLRVDGGRGEVLGLGPGGSFTNVVFPATNYGFWSLMDGRDLDGDGDEDVVGQAYPYGVRVAFNDGAGALVPESINMPSHPSYREAGDIDGDGDLDLLTTLWVASNATPMLSLNDGRGGMTEVSLPIGAPMTGPGVLLDADNDGDLDRYTVQATTHDYVRNDGPAGFVVATTNPVPNTGVAPTATRSVAADLDGDGLLDVLIASGPLNANLVAFNTGAGFAAPVPYDPALNTTSDLDAADFDGDGDVDVVEADQPGGVRILLNNGVGAMTPGAVIGGNSEFVIAGDVDLDGDVDLVTAGQVSLNDGTGAFPSSIVLPFGVSRAPVALVDTDLDGDLDLIGARLFTQSALTQTVHLVNDGTGTFTVMTLIDRVTGWWYDTRFPVGDVDGDGDPDLLAGASVWRINTLRHVHAVGVPRPGVPLTIQVDAPPGTAYELWASPALIPPAVLPQGTLWLDPTVAIRVATANVGASGVDEYAFPVPANPALAGASIHWQAWVVGQGALTSAVTTTF